MRCIRASDQGRLGRLPASRTLGHHMHPRITSADWFYDLVAFAAERHNLAPYDLVLSSSHAVSKGVITRPDQLHISYVHTPIRYAWDLRRACFPGIRGALTWPLLQYIRWWDKRAAGRVDVFVANSENVRQRIWRHYGREARVLYPPVNVAAFQPQVDRDDFYLCVSRFVPYKKVDLVVRAFTELGYPLVVIGEGPQTARIQALAGPNVQMLGFQPDSVVRDHMQRCKAFVFAAEEVFGITVVEAQAAGAPVIAFRGGGALETVIEGQTGRFFEEQTTDSIVYEVRGFEEAQDQYDLELLRQNAARFSVDRFKADYSRVVDEAWGTFRASGRGTA